VAKDPILQEQERTRTYRRGRLASQSPEAHRSCSPSITQQRSRRLQTAEKGKDSLILVPTI
jgi:hypothetical protein